MVTVQAEMTFLEPWPSTVGKESPYLRHITTPSYPSTNFKNETHVVSITDARSNASSFTLDRNAFAFRNTEPLSAGLVEAIREKKGEEVERELYPTVERLVKKWTGAKKVVVFDHGYRKRDPEIDMQGGKNAYARGQPATVVHCDQSEWGGKRRVEKHTGEEAQELLKGRCQIINVWRPLTAPVRDWPLAVMDYSTLSASHIHPCSLYSKEHDLQGQTVGINHDEEQKWYYLSEQRPDEVTLVKIWDSKVNAARLCAHCAFLHPDARAEDVPRESVEVRCLVFH
ncbi:cmcJ-like methyltransferase [Lentithecium fluviatile CBS 122367]|uniref:CmcJ-like methyltransferase n=1 Tax=Lentithecium fluviatile CBS 122367 TaxID=1168545 RepID=A0A6G1IGC9_9PLEO|nr:cmcJ-like methyltransferase [Lentithecium fluviatile CBS 122367]